MAEVFEAKLRKIGNSLGVIIPSEIIDELGYHKGDVVHIDISNDPTPLMAGSVVSLGYYCWRFTLLEPRVMKTNPFMIIGKSENLKYKLIRPCRRAL